MAIIRFYKYVLVKEKEWIYRYSIPNLETLNIQYNTPISPMPLPEENAKENILVKIEGNSASIDIDWTLADYKYGEGDCHFQMWDSGVAGETLEPDNTNVRGKFDPVGRTGYPITFRDFEEPTGNYPRTGNPAKQVQLFKEYFESTSLNNDYLITIEDGDANNYGTAEDPMRIYGSPSQMSFSISGSSPIVWRARIQFFEGNVITVFDPDSPESPQDLSMVAVENFGTSPNNNRDVFKIRFKDPTSFGATDTHTVFISYRRAGKLTWYTAEYGIDTGTDGDATKLEKETAGADEDYYVLYLPIVAHEEKPAASDKNAFLNASGHFDTGTTAPSGSLKGGYAHTAIDYKMIGSTATKPQYYDVKVYFENSSGDGGTAEESEKTVTD